jgi:Mg2+ and Co2+ transporter CorA
MFSFSRMAGSTRFLSTRADLEKAEPVWVDLTDPTDDERAWVKTIYGVTCRAKTKSRTSKRRPVTTKRKTATCTCAPTSCWKKRTARRAS